MPFGPTILRDQGRCAATGFDDVSIDGARRRDRRALRPDRRRAQRIRAEPVRPLPGDGGRDRLAGQAGRRSVPSARRCDLGIALAPESRRDQGLCLNLGVGFNINLPIFDRLTQRPGHQRARARRGTPTGRSRICRSRPRRATPMPSSLSGGNQQKIVIGKWLNHGAKLFIFDEPTVGVDVGTKAEIYRLLGALLKARRRHHPDLLLPAGGLRTRRHAARVPARPDRREPRSARTPRTRKFWRRRSASEQAASGSGGSSDECPDSVASRCTTQAAAPPSASSSA